MKKWGVGVGAMVAGLAMLAGLWAGYDFYFNQQSGWRCFQEAHDPREEIQLFAECIVEKTRWAMTRNPHLYGANPGEDIDPSEIDFEFLGVAIEEGGQPIYRFRYLYGGNSFCRYYVPDDYGQYFVQGAYAEAGDPNLC